MLKIKNQIFIVLVLIFLIFNLFSMVGFMGKKKYFRLKWWLAFMSIMIIYAIYSHNISKHVTSEDIKYIKKFISNPEINNSANFSIYSKKLSFEEQINLAKEIQGNVLKIAPIGTAIPKNTSRNPKDLYIAKQGLCYDRSNVLEKIFESIGFETRHLSLFAHTKNQSVLTELTSSNILSHSIFELKTKRGWLIIDTNSNWISLSEDNSPISMKILKEKDYSIKWKYPPPFNCYTEYFTHIYGLYSRHGKFYKPYNFIPDFRIQELFYNF